MVNVNGIWRRKGHINGVVSAAAALALIFGASVASAQGFEEYDEEWDEAEELFEEEEYEEYEAEEVFEETAQPTRRQAAPAPSPAPAQTRRRKGPPPAAGQAPRRKAPPAAAGQAPRRKAPAQAPKAASAPVGDSDHDLWVGRMGIGWYGVSSIPLGSDTVTAPAVGVRYWINSGVGIDAALGFSMSSGADTGFANGQGDSVADHPSTVAFLLHGGLPLALFSEKHYTLLLTPEVNLGFASGRKRYVAGGADTDLSGYRVDVGARLGAEIHFGFIGLPALAVEGSFGLFLTTQGAKEDTGGDGQRYSTTYVGTSAFNSPWDIFTGGVTARYYF